MSCVFGFTGVICLLQKSPPAFRSVRPPTVFFFSICCIVCLSLDFVSLLSRIVVSHPPPKVSPVPTFFCVAFALLGDTSQGGTVSRPESEGKTCRVRSPPDNPQLHRRAEALESRNPRKPQNRKGAHKRPQTKTETFTSSRQTVCKAAHLDRSWGNSFCQRSAGAAEPKPAPSCNQISFLLGGPKQLRN